MNNELLIDFCKAVRNSTIKRLKVVPGGYENWRISKNSLSFAEISKHLIDSDDWTINKIKNPGIKSILAVEGSIEDCSSEEFFSFISALEQSLERKIKFIDSLDKEKMESKIYDDRFNDEVNIEWVFLRGNLDHEIHHRGQIAVYLRMLKDKQVS